MTRSASCQFNPYPQNLVVNSVSHAGEASTRTVSRRLSRLVATSSPMVTSNTPSSAFPALPVSMSRPRQRIIASRETRPSSISGNAAPMPKASIVRATWARLALGGKDRGGPKRRTDTRAPDRAKEEPKAELTEETARRKGVGIAAGPVADRTCRERKSLLQSRHQEQDTHGDEQDGRDGAKDVRVEAGGKAYRRDEQADGGERNGEARGKRRRAQPVFAGRGAENDRHKRQHTRRKNRQHSCKKCKSQGGDGHFLRLIESARAGRRWMRYWCRRPSGLSRFHL